MIEAFLLSLVTNFGYLGVFLASLIGSAATFVPLPSFLIVITAGSVLNPAVVGVVAGVGAALGELVGYGVGLGFFYSEKKFFKKKKLSKKEKGWTKIIEKWFNRKLGMLVIFIFAVTPLPDKIVGVFCGAIKYDIKKFLFAMLVGKIVLHLILAYIGFYGIHFIGAFF
ncbi:MAG: VTT domain-containing protein [Candidatus Aenigmarchaeota archaeon]|nr:VTT domain-containing protein [Candidatus Aenigmarchaeota archaeon]